jgi:Eco57I restriction-modification methylase
LFFRGFAEPRTDSNRAAIETQFGKVPYLNGGLFAEHKIERSYAGLLDVLDAAFVALFAFFDQWEWHLDERPLKNGKEINPDVLGYIFEKFVNQKQMGAYYTKEDITEYIGKNTIIPSLLATVQTQHPQAFADHAWALLQNSGDDYIYASVLKGIDNQKTFTYPPHIAQGLDTEAPDLATRRAQWNTRASDAASLPTETWREAIARHQRAQALRATIASGELQNISDLITHNLNIRQFAQDFIERCTDIDMLHSVWVTLAGQLPSASNPVFKHGITVLDPTCGSGAFLFAALNILKPLYDATLRTLHALRMDAVLAQTAPSNQGSNATLTHIDATLARFAANAGTERAQDYQVIKHIIVHNLYGVDIEEQATEIAKLRLFLKLVALLEPGDNIEPLPDIDFNIRHGNTLVGYATAVEAELAVRGRVGEATIAGQGLLGLNDRWDAIAQSLQTVERQYNAFQLRQVQRGGHVSRADKDDLERALGDLNEQLNYHLGKEYGVSEGDTAGHAVWKFDHQPFHWVVDFYPIMARGGFDVVIGNPPYLEYSKIRPTYEIKATKINTNAGNLYAFTTERCLDLMSLKGSIGLIVPVSLVSTQRMAGLQTKFIETTMSWFSNYGERPAKLFSGAEVLLTIVIAMKSVPEKITHVTGLRKWSVEQREHLFNTTQYVTNVATLRGFVLPKLTEQIESSVLSKIMTNSSRLGAALRANGQSSLFYRIGGGRYWKIFTNYSPKFVLNGVHGKSSRESTLKFETNTERELACGLLSSSIFFWFFSITTNGRDLNPIDLQDFPTDLMRLEINCPTIVSLATQLMSSYQLNSQMRLKKSSHTGEIEYQEFYPRLSKNIINSIDEELSKFYSLTPVELDYIINYDIKYRMGLNGAEGDDD